MTPEALRDKGLVAEAEVIEYQLLLRVFPPRIMSCG
jgi:hypothetical protein